MTKKYKIVYLKKDCIGAGACETAAPNHWFFDRETSIATLKDPTAVKTDEKEELIIEEKDLELHQDAAQVCPVQIIEIFDLETGKKVFPK